MIIVDQKLEELEKKRKPIRVGMIGAGFMAKGIAHQIIQYSKGIKLVACANRTIERAESLFEGYKDNYYVTKDATRVINDPDIDIIVEVTGNIDYGADIVLQTIKAGKHIVTMSAELDATIGPILNHYAKKSGVVYTVADGDQPGVTQNLMSFVKDIGVTPVLCGNIKGLQDEYRNPTTQAGFAKKWGQNPTMVTSFADGSKISFEQTVTANANGMRVAKLGMHGPTVNGDDVSKAASWYPEQSLEIPGGIVDYVVGATPAAGVFVIGKTTDPQHKHYLNLYKLGEGPYYVFYVPYHLCHFEVPASIARAVLFKNETVASQQGPMVEVITKAKIDLKKGTIMDGIGGYHTYGIVENHTNARKENLLPMAFAQGSVLKKDMQKDAAISIDDVTLNTDTISYKLWQEQNTLFQ